VPTAAATKLLHPPSLLQCKQPTALNPNTCSSPYPFTTKRLLEPSSADVCNLFFFLQLLMAFSSLPFHG
jgi:hypothetical protein